MGTKPIDRETLRELEVVASEMGRLIGGVMERSMPGFGFVLLLFGFDEHSELTYVSNAERGDMILALEEITTALRNNLDTPPGEGELPQIMEPS